MSSNTIQPIVDNNFNLSYIGSNLRNKINSKLDLEAANGA